MAENPSVIFPLRCLLLSIYNPEAFEEIVKLEAHLEKRRDTAIWRRHRISVEDVLKETNLITQKDVEEELVQKICGILDVNSFEVSFALQWYLKLGDFSCEQHEKLIQPLFL